MKKFTDECLEQRNLFVDDIRKQILGPGSEITIDGIENELITDPPEVRYSVGILYPQDIKVTANINDEEVISEEDVQENNTSIQYGNKYEKEFEKYNDDVNVYDSQDESDENDENVNLSLQNRPSSFGFIFLAKGTCNRLILDVDLATYRPAIKEDCCITNFLENEECKSNHFLKYVKFEEESNCWRIREKITKELIDSFKNNDELSKSEKNILYKLYRQNTYGWKREPHKFSVTLELNKDYVEKVCKCGHGEVKFTVLKKNLGEVVSINIMMLNNKKDVRNKRNIIMQPHIVVDSASNSFKFVDRNQILYTNEHDEEDVALAMLYRKQKNYATGLGTSINWDIDKSGNGFIETEFLPKATIPSMDFELRETIKSEKQHILSMKYHSDLSSDTKENKISALNKFISDYEDWVNELNVKKENLTADYRDISDRHILACKNAAQRMRTGLNILNNDKLAYEAFTLANRAMYMQRVQLNFQKSISNTTRFRGDNDISDWFSVLDFYKTPERMWRPFQMAFLLLSISGITDENSVDHQLVDLIWFPTGGGKTEAYLGLSAFVIFYRRLHYPKNCAGTNIIMRYTLRLLTAQQFTRAATLICACEYIRQDSLARKAKYPKHQLGKNKSDEFTIGLYIGGNHTPNKNDEASRNLNELSKAKIGSLNYIKDFYNKFQVLKCPWCSTSMVKEEINGQVTGDWGYHMSGNHFYMNCPHEKCSFHKKLPVQVVDEELYTNPPTLLIGTVDKFAMLAWRKETGNFFGKKNKWRAPELIIQDELHLISGPLGTMTGLYETAIDKICQHVGNSPKIIASTATIRRAREQCSSLYNREICQFPPPGLDADDSYFARYNYKNYGREYVGVMASGKTKEVMESRIIAALMQHGYNMNIADEVKDVYWTTTVYFNTLRELGQCATMVEDSIPEDMRRLAYRTNSGNRYIHTTELTSRVSTTELNRTLDRLEKISYHSETTSFENKPIDILLSSNMISVGIDVARLNIMLMVGQPKLTSEYIQASSRVGRFNPGLIFTIYDNTRSRDRSFYEQFPAYHESFYRYVEPTGVTPFSKPARDRALHAILVAMIRNMTNLSDDKNAQDFSKDKLKDVLKEIKEFIINRVHEIHKRTEPNLRDESSDIEKEIEAFFDFWEEQTATDGQLSYGFKYIFKSPDDNARRLLRPYYSPDKGQDARPTLTSMRNVDAMIKGKILLWEEDNK